MDVDTALSNRIRGGWLSVAALWISSVACDPAAESEPNVPLGGTEELIANLVHAGFDEAHIELRADGQALVEGDVLMSLEASRSLTAIGFRQYRTNAKVDADHTDIVIDVDPKLREDQVFLQAVHEAIARWNGVRSRFQLELAHGGQETDDTSIELRTWEDAAPDGADALADFPVDGRPGARILVNPHKLVGANPLVLRHMVMHELGHALGLRHTDYATRSSCEEGEQGPEDEDSDGAIQIDGTPGSEGDARSVMNACIPPATSGEWTCYDRRAIKAL